MRHVLNDATLDVCQFIVRNEPARPRVNDRAKHRAVFKHQPRLTHNESIALAEQMTENFGHSPRYWLTQFHLKEE